MMMPPTHVIALHVIALHVIALNGWRGRSEVPLQAWLAAGIRADQQHAIPNAAITLWFFHRAVNECCSVKALN
jgi:hypothetical protein